MEKNIIVKIVDFFLKLNIKIVSIYDIVHQMVTSKKKTYSYLINKELFLDKNITIVHRAVHGMIETIIIKEYNAIEENFEIRKKFKEMFSATNSSPISKLKKKYPDLYRTLLSKEVQECKKLFKQNIEKGIREELYRKDLNFRDYISFYYLLIFSVNENIISEKDLDRLELEALEYHTRAMTTEKGIIELEKQLKRYSL